MILKILYRLLFSLLFVVSVKAAEFDGSFYLVPHETETLYRYASRFIEPLADSYVKSGVDTLSEGSKNEGTLMSELWDEKDFRLKQLSYLAMIPYCVTEPGRWGRLLSKEELSEKKANPHLQYFNLSGDEYVTCKTISELIKSLESEHYKDVKILGRILKNKGLFIFDEEKGITGAHGSLIEHFQLMCPFQSDAVLNRLKVSYNSLFLGTDNQSLSSVLTPVLKDILNSYEYKSWTVALGAALSEFKSTKELGLKVLGITHRNKNSELWEYLFGRNADNHSKEKQFSTAFTIDSMGQNVYVLSMGTKDKFPDFSNHNFQIALKHNDEKNFLKTIDVHKGFYNAAFGTEFWAIAQNVFQNYPQANYYFVGHSLGGAMANLQGLAFTEQFSVNLQKNQVKIFTCSAPVSTIPSDSLKAIVQKISDENIFNLTIMNDPVPTALEKFSYKPVGVRGVIPMHLCGALAQGQIPGLAEHKMNEVITNISRIHPIYRKIIEALENNDKVPSVEKELESYWKNPEDVGTYSYVAGFLSGTVNRLFQK